MRRRVLAGIVVALAAVPVAAYEIGIFADSTATSCSLQIDAPTVRYVWVVALLDGGELPVIGADFSIRGFPEDWSVVVAPHPLQDGAELFGGSPFPHVLLAFFDSRRAPGGIVPLAKIHIFAMSQVGPTRVWIDRALPHRPSPPAGPGYEGPVLLLEEPSAECEGGSPRYVAVQVQGLSAMINGPCTVAVESTTWQRVKSLYRE